jgi:GNAT superfamily N-acetyltransferase
MLCILSRIGSDAPNNVGDRRGNDLDRYGPILCETSSKELEWIERVSLPIKAQGCMTKIEKVLDLDIGVLQELRAESSREGFRFMERLCEDWVSGANRFDAPGEALFLAVADGQVVGVCGINRDPYAHDLSTGRVRRLYVLPAHRRGGIGRTLIEAVITHARGQFNKLRVRTHAADTFYAAHGFRRDASTGDATHVLELAPILEKTEI